jgi:signal transduction histidine kinase
MPATAWSGSPSWSRRRSRNTPARDDLTRLAEEQAALRRVATLVARGAPRDEVFDAVAGEVTQLFRATAAGVVRYLPEEPRVEVAGRTTGPDVSLGMRLPSDDPTAVAAVLRTGQSARVDDWQRADPAASGFRRLGVKSSVASPITVEGELWGAVGISSTEMPLPADTGSRLEKFSALVGTAIANIDARSALSASRARIVAAADEERRRVVRDLHDGAQQRLVHTTIMLKLAQRALERDAADAPSLVGEALDHAQRATHELRELAHGILPAALTAGGLQAGVDALASRMPMPVQVEICPDRLSAAIEATAYFVVAEALTNVVKHAHAATAAVAVRVEDGTLRVEVRDDGIGGVRPEGSGLQGLGDRLAGPRRVASHREPRRRRNAGRGSHPHRRARPSDRPGRGWSSRDGLARLRRARAGDPAEQPERDQGRRPPGQVGVEAGVGRVARGAGEVGAPGWSAGIASENW